jgi:hypothetical protein
MPAPGRRTTADFIAGLPASEARDRLAQSLPGRVLRAELPSLDAQPRDIAAIKLDIAADLAPYDALHVLACIVPLVSFTRPETYTELDEEPAATVEYIASVLLERPSPEPTAQPQAPETMSGAIQRSLDRTRGIALQAIFDGRRRRDSGIPALERVALDVAVRDAISRWPGYGQQERSLAGHLAADDTVAAYLRRQIGFDLAQALELEAAVGVLVEHRYNAHAQQTADTIHNLEAEFDANPQAVPEALRVRSAAERSQRGAWLLAQELFSVRLKDALVITSADLAMEANVDHTVAAAFLKALSCQFGDTKGTSILTGRNQVRRRPFMADGQGGYLLTAPGNLLWALRPLTEAVTKQDEAIFHLYEGVRSRYVESETARSFVKALKPREIWTNLAYELNGATYEADVLVKIDDMCIVIEAKGGGLSDNARRGRKRELKRELKALLGKSTEQVGRLTAELRAGRTPAFYDRVTRKPVETGLAGIQRVEAVVVTLEDLGFVATQAVELREAGVLGPGHPPWTVSLYDLQAIANSCAYAAQLTSYIGRRRAIDERVEFVDECDLWMLHLRETLDFSAVRGRVILVEGRSDDLNRAWMFGARMPTMTLDKSAKRRLREADRKRAPGFIAAGEQLIDDAQRGRRPRVRAF